MCEHNLNQEWSCCPHSAAGRVVLCRQDLGSSKLWLVSYTPPFSLLLSLPPLSLLCILLALASLPSWGLVTMVTGGMLSSVAGWRYPHVGSQRPSAQPLRGGGVSPETLNNEQETTPHDLSLSPYIAHSHPVLCLAVSLPSLSLSLSSSAQDCLWTPAAWMSHHWEPELFSSSQPG